MPATEKILLEMFEVIEGRKTADPETSYTARLFAKDLEQARAQVLPRLTTTLICRPPK